MLTVPFGLTEQQFDDISVRVRSAVTYLGDDFAVHGSRVASTAQATSDLDIAIRISAQRFDEVIVERFGTPRPGSAKEKTMQHARKTGKIQAGEAGLRQLRKELEALLGMEVDIAVICEGGPFDRGPTSPCENPMATRTMTSGSELDCTVFVDADVERSALAQMLAELHSGSLCEGTVTPMVHTSNFEIEVRANPERNTKAARDFPDAFLSFQLVLEIYAGPSTRREAKVELVSKLLTFLWSQGWPAVAASDYEAELPHRGGYNCPSMPWRAATPTSTAALE